MAAPAVHREEGPERVVLERGAHFHGLVSFLGVARIDGDVVGQVRAAGTLIVGAGARVEADVEVDELIVEGTVVGDMRARRRIDVRAGARVEGDLSAPILSAAEGCLIVGRCATGRSPD